MRRNYRKINNQKYVAYGVVFALLALAVGFAAFSDVLRINGSVKVEANKLIFVKTPNGNKYDNFHCGRVTVSQNNRNVDDTCNSTTNVTIEETSIRINNVELEMVDWGAAGVKTDEFFVSFVVQNRGNDTVDLNGFNYSGISAAFQQFTGTTTFGWIYSNSDTIGTVDPLLVNYACLVSFDKLSYAQDILFDSSSIAPSCTKQDNFRKLQPGKYAGFVLQSKFRTDITESEVPSTIISSPFSMSLKAQI